MSSAAETRDRSLSNAHTGFAALASAISILSLVGWLTNQQSLTSLAAGRPPLSVMTAVMVLLGVVAVLASPLKGAISWIFGILVAMGGVAILIARATALAADIELPSGIWSSALTGLMFLLTGTSSAMIGRRLFVEGQLVAVGLLLASVLLGLGHLVPLSVLYRYLPGTGVSIPTIICFVSLAISGLLACRHSGIAASLSSGGATGRPGLKMLLTGAACVLVASAAVLESLRAHVIDAETAIMLLCWSALAALGGTLWALAIAADRAEQATENSNLEKERLRQTFAAAVTHDLRNPLQTAMLAANLLAKLNDDPKFAGLLARLQRSHKRLDRMLKASLDKIALDSGKEMAANKSLVDLHSVIDEVVSENLAVLEERVTIEGHGTGHWDADAIFRVVENLLLNALKYGNPGTVIECSIQSSATHVQLLVHNSGPPIPESDWSRIFEPFTRGQNHQGRTGWGVGLAFSRMVAEKHNGTLTVVRSDEHGTVFQLTLPLE
ncbi:sensor histidine kinase [Paracidovorax citrulli]|nr:putative sensor histidine kinase TcrY [Paracidovorax citrulli]UMT96032.1 HAMP domain-containing histidine kinase [Paracidovorax citrulli]